MTLVVAGLMVLFASALMSMAGLGAAAFYVPLFFWLGVPLVEVLPSALFLNVIALSLATVNYVRYGLVNFRIGLPVVGTAVVCTPLGALTSQYLDRDVILSLFAGFLVLAALSMFFYRPRLAAGAAAAETGAETGAGAAENGGRDARHEDGRRLPIGLGVGVATGYIAGLLAIGGGVVVIPALNYLRYPPKMVAATTCLVAFCASFSGFVGHVVFGQLNHSLLLVTGICAALGALLGSWLVRYRISGGGLKTVIGVLMLVIAARLILDLLL